MAKQYDELTRISELGSFWVPTSKIFAWQMENYAKQLDIPNLAVAVVFANEAYDRAMKATAGWIIKPNSLSEFGLESNFHAQQLFIATAAINLGLAYKEGFNVQVNTKIQPGTLFSGIASVVGEIIEFRRNVSSKKHLSHSKTLFNAAKSFE